MREKHHPRIRLRQKWLRHALHQRQKWARINATRFLLLQQFDYENKNPSVHTGTHANSGPHHGVDTTLPQTAKASPLPGLERCSIDVNAWSLCHHHPNEQP